MPEHNVPEAGDRVWLRFDPQRLGHRPALVLSLATYNRRTRLMVCCPLTTKIKGYPFEVMVTDELVSIVLSDQVKSLDWRTRRAGFRGKVSQSVLAEVRAKAIALLNG